jgi:hypothetical protein
MIATVAKSCELTKEERKDIGLPPNQRFSLVPF